jgi:HKD family nuclease
VFHIRHNNLVPRLIASSKGYWIATSKEEIESWLNSLNSRIGALMETREYATSMLSQWGENVQEQKETIIQTQLFNNYGS